MSLPDRAHFLQPPGPGASEPFIWATGIEDTFIVDPYPLTGRTLDEYELTGHYEQWQGDIDRVAELGVAAIRYGIPWYRVEPQRGRFDWSWTDQVLARIAGCGIEPIIDLVHYGTPPWLTGSFFNPEASIGLDLILGGETPRDSDSDGVIDRFDKCPGTPLGCWVDEKGCPRDSDGATASAIAPAGRGSPGHAGDPDHALPQK